MQLTSSLFKTGLVALLSALSMHAASLISEAFDALPAPDKWKADASVGVREGALVLTASGTNTGYANSAFVMKAGDPLLNFTAKPIEIEFRELAVGGTAGTGNSVMVMILSSDTPGEGKAASYLKLRLSDDGALLLMCGGAGAKESSIHSLSAKLVFPLKSLKVKLSATGFSIIGTDASKEFSGEGKWAPPFNVTVWSGAAPYLMIRSVRRPGEGQAEVKIGALVVANTP